MQSKATKTALTGQDHDNRHIVLRMAISDLIRSQRKLSPIVITQEQLAMLSGISFEHLNHIENYRTMPSLEVLDKIARALGFKTVSEFLLQDEKQIL